MEVHCGHDLAQAIAKYRRITGVDDHYLAVDSPSTAPIEEEPGLWHFPAQQSQLYIPPPAAVAARVPRCRPTGLGWPAAGIGGERSGAHRRTPTTRGGSAFSRTHTTLLPSRYW